MRALIEAVEAYGTPMEHFLRAAGVSAGAYEAPYAWVPASELDHLIELAVVVTGDPALGLHWNERSQMLKFDLLAAATAYAPSLREAIASVLRFQSLLCEAPELTAFEREGTMFLRLAPVATTELATRVRGELGVSSLVRLVRHSGAPTEAVRRITFSHPEPTYVREYSRLLGLPVEFGQACAGIEVDARWLDRRVPYANLELHQLLSRQAQNVMARVHPGALCADQLREWLHRVLPRLPSSKDAARALVMSERSLRRRLTEEGFTYSAILDETRQRRAHGLLLSHILSIKQVASEVGFTNGTAFTRAFKRWTGESPLAYRSARLRAVHTPSGSDEGHLASA